MQALTLLVVLLAYSVNAQTWESPYFIDPGDPDVTFVDYDGGKIVQVFLNEAVTREVIIATLSYTGATKPAVTLSVGNELYLGLDIRQSGGTWNVYVTLPQDFEQIEFYELGITVEGDTDKGQIYLAISNVNDNSPYFNAPSSCSVRENFALNQAIENCAIEIIDADGVQFNGNQMILTAVDDNPDYTFDLVLKQVTEDRMTAELKITNKQLDFESLSLHTVKLRAENSDNTDFFGEYDLILRVLDVADQPPVWTKLPLSLFQATEEATSTMDFTARDGDTEIDDNIVYVLEEATPDGVFSLEDPKVGLLTVNAPDRDSQTTLTPTVNICAYEEMDENSKICSQVSVLIQDANDNSPTFSPSEPISITIDERATGSLPFTDPIVITDLDLATSGQFRMELTDDSGTNNWNSAFNIVPSTGYQTQSVEISIVNPDSLNYEDENWREIVLKLTATEVADDTHIGTNTITITLRDTNDESPVFGLASYEATLEENTPVDTSVATVTATDLDFGDTIQYSLLPSNSPFQIDPSTGVVTVRTSINYEVQSLHQLQIKAMDAASHATSVDLVVTITDINDERPVLVIDGSSQTVDENSPVGYEVSSDISATDSDSTADLEFAIDWTKTYATRKGIRISDTDVYTDCLSIATNAMGDGLWTGVITVADEAKLDYEQFDTIYLFISVTDKFTSESYQAQSTGMLTIQLNNLADSPPVFDESTLEPKTVYENGATDLLIGYAVATNPDNLGTIVYSITETGETPVGWVKIDPQSGAMKTTDIPIDAEVLVPEELVLTYTVRATVDALFSDAEIIINVLDVNDNDPVFDPITNPEPIPEDAVDGTPVATLVAKDLDVSDPFSINLCYELDQNANNYGMVDKLFNVDITTGQVTVLLKDGETLDRETSQTITVYVRVRDNCPYISGSPTTKYGQSSFVVTLEDVNDEKPTFPSSTITIPEVTEYLPQNDVIYEIEATDKDDPATDNAKITYTITDVKGIDVPNPVDLFYLADATDTTANLKTGKPLLGFNGQYEISILAEDRGTPTQSSSTKYYVTIRDENNNKPQFQYPPSDYFEIIISGELTLLNGPLINYMNSDEVPDIYATDGDTGENAAITFSIEGDDNAKNYIYLVDGTEGRSKMYLKQEFPNNMPQFNLTARAKDNGDPQQATDIHMVMYVISELNDEPYFVDQTNAPISWEENGAKIQPVQLSIADDANNNLNIRPPSLFDPIYYYLTEAIQGNMSYFSLDKEKNILSLLEPLDREKDSVHELVVVASNEDGGPPSAPSDSQKLTVIVNVLDQADYPPYFESDLQVGGIAPSDTIGFEVMRIRAVDLDDPTVDTILYSIVPGTMNASESYLEEVMDSAFYIENEQNPESLAHEGVLYTNFRPAETWKGYFEFVVRAVDSAQFDADTNVQVYIIAASNRVYFLFLNTVDYVNDHRDDIIRVFSSNLGYRCSIDEVAIADTSKADSNRTTVRTHFIDEANNLPVEGSLIEALASDFDTFLTMQQELNEVGLNLIDVIPTSQPKEDNLAEILTIVLIVVSVVLGSLVLILFLAFVFKTRSLNRRLKALTTTRFGSQESGLNRLGMQVPNTNKHAVEGSNPVWNEDYPTYDRHSQSSGDSELIGVEDRPEFNYNTRSSIGLHVDTQEGGYYSGSEIAAAAASSDRGIASTEL